MTKRKIIVLIHIEVELKYIRHFLFKLLILIFVSSLDLIKFIWLFKQDNDNDNNLL